LDLKEIKLIIDLMKKNDLSLFELEREGIKLKLKRGADIQTVYSTGLPVAAPAAALGATAAAPASATAPVVEPGAALKEIKSPMVGSFYRSPSPDKPPYIEVGQEVTEETVVCIIEAMKTFNEIKSEVRGTVVEVLADNGKPVQFDQVLFRVK
jgi:acetyl-CoA carboxylase biotin carboxyl carrier protein